jgi:hypothetical protein
MGIPMTSKQDATMWAKHELIPFLNNGEDDLGAPVDRLVLATIVRRAAIARVPVQSLIDEVEHHYRHQSEYIDRSKH